MVKQIPFLVLVGTLTTTTPIPLQPLLEGRSQSLEAKSFKLYYDSSRQGAAQSPRRNAGLRPGMSGGQASICRSTGSPEKVGAVIGEVTRPGSLTCTPESVKAVPLQSLLVSGEPRGREGGCVVELASAQPRKQSREN